MCLHALHHLAMAHGEQHNVALANDVLDGMEVATMLYVSVCVRLVMVVVNPNVLGCETWP